MGRQSGTHLDNWFAVNSIPRVKEIVQRQGEASENLKVFEQKLTRGCRTLVTECLADLGPRKGKSKPKCEKSEYLKVFEQKLTRGCRKLVTDYLAD